MQRLCKTPFVKAAKGLDRAFWHMFWIFATCLVASGCLAERQGPKSGAEAFTRIDIDQTVVRGRLPGGFIGFNMNHYNFQNQFWDRTVNQVDSRLIEYLTPFGGAFYRYPGGLVANTFDWEGATGPIAQRPARRSVKWSKAEPLLFGPAEYIEFVRKVGGRDWYVLNLVGWDAELMNREMDSRALAESNGRLAGMRVKTSAAPRYYQLGNELDRADYQWPTGKYVKRSLDSVEAIRAVDPDARFVAFLRDFDWRYRGRPGVSRAKDFARDVLGALPMVHDFSLQIYYDAPSEEGRKSDIAWRLRMVREIIDEARTIRSGTVPNVWITEHARALPRDRGKSDPEFASGLDGAISSADFIIGITQIPEIQGAFWHALGGGKWNVIEKHPSGNIQTTPVYWMLRLLRENMDGHVLRTATTDGNISGYEGGYDVRAVALYQPDKRILTLWLVNRADAIQKASLNFAAFAGRKCQSQVSYLNEKTLRDPGPRPLRQAVNTIFFNDRGSAEITLPGRSVAVVRISPAH